MAKIETLSTTAAAVVNNSGQHADILRPDSTGAVCQFSEAATATSAHDADSYVAFCRIPPGTSIWSIMVRLPSASASQATVAAEIQLAERTGENAYTTEQVGSTDLKVSIADITASASHKTYADFPAEIDQWVCDNEQTFVVIKVTGAATYSSAWKPSVKVVCGFCRNNG